MAFDASAIRVPSRSRTAWWIVTLALGATLGFVLYSFVGTFVFGLFVYYGTRPLFGRLRRVTGSDGIAAALALFAVVTPTLLLAGYVAAVGLVELGSNLGSYADLLDPYVDITGFDDPRQVLSRLQNADGTSVGGALETSLGVLRQITNGLLHLFVALTVVFYLLRDGNRIADWFRSQVAIEGTVTQAYATAVDRDLETLYFSYFLLVFLVAGGALVVYHGYNAVAPDAVLIPMPTFLALLTGVASLIPIVVSKLVYVPLVAYLGALAYRADAALAYPIGLLVVCFLLLDILPQMVVLPQLAGRELHTGLVMLSFVLGSMLFGWYGVFLGPLVVILAIQLVRLVFAELVHGDPLTAAVTAAESIGSPPASTAESGDDPP